MSTEGSSTLKLEELVSVIKEIHGPNSELVNYSTAKGTATVQGFLSNIIRVTANVLKDKKVFTTKFIAKKMPALQNQIDLVVELGVFEQEIGFFEHCASPMRKQCPDFPAVKCYLTNKDERIIYMEDLKELGFTALVCSFPDLKDSSILTIDRVELIFKTLAKFHSCSWGTDWLEKCPDVFEVDVAFEKGDGAVFKKMIKQSVESNMIPMTQLQFPNNASYMKSIKWLASEDFYQRLVSLAKVQFGGVNVLCHGDSWANNFMFKIDPETGTPLEIKLIDFQICRFAPGTRDLLYFFYMSTISTFQQKHEKELLKLYMQTFNENCEAMGKEAPLTWEAFYEDYNNARIYGLIMAVLFRPMIYVTGSFPTGDEELSEEHFNKILDGGADSTGAIQEFNDNEIFRNEMISIIEEVRAEYEKLIF